MLLNILMLLGTSYISTCLQTYTTSQNTNPAVAVDVYGLIYLGNVTVGDQFTFDIKFYPDTGYTPTRFTLYNLNSQGQPASNSVGGWNTQQNIPTNLTSHFDLTVSDTTFNYVTMF